MEFSWSTRALRIYREDPTGIEAFLTEYCHDLVNQMVEHYSWGVSSGSGSIIGSEEAFLVMRAGEREAES